MTPNEAADEGARARKALDEFLTPAFDAVIADYVARLTELASTEPGQVDRISKLAIAVKVARNVKGQIEAIVQSGGLAEAGIKRARQIEQLSPERKKFLGIPVRDA